MMKKKPSLDQTNEEEEEGQEQEREREGGGGGCVLIVSAVKVNGKLKYQCVSIGARCQSAAWARNVV